MRACSSRPFCSGDGRHAGLWYLAAGYRYTTPRTREILLQHGYIINEYEVRDAAERQKLHDQYREAISNARAVIERDWKQAYELLTQATNLEHRLTSTCYWLTEKAFAALKDEDEP